MRISTTRIARPIEVWGGLECTINRVRDRWHDQFELGPLAARVDTIDLVAGLGISALRYPLVWERVAPGNLGDIDWTWSDARMERMREVGIAPIAGLVHHGSGPRHTSLLDPLFPEKLALYARAVAERYPDLRYVTPVNEPLTTARFSGLYGHWYPHHRSKRSFAVALLRQCAAVRAAIRAMREVIPDLELIQTEDLGRVSSTPELKYQADFENERRWLTYDLLTGRVDDGHPMWKYIGVDSDAIALLELLATDPCPPDVIGINYYVTSDRHLDHRLELYPDLQAGGNGIDAYVDVEAVRVPESRIAGHRAILQEAWNRYRIPVAFTEVHLACSREQQVQWLLAAWDGARAARTSGCEVRAVTAWALMGSFGWDKLLTERPFAYESGAFDTRSGSPRRTAVASVIEDLARRGRTTHVTAIAEPWWNTSVATTPVGNGIALPPSSLRRGALILGGTGTLGTAFQRICQSRGVPFRALSRSELDISDRAAVASAIEGIRPTMVINAAGYVRVNDAERDERGCNLANVRGPSVLARECALRRIPLVTFSSDLVFDGRKSSPYVESDYTGPLNVYGASKAAGEKEVLESHPSALVVRTSAFFGPWDEFNFATVALRRLLDGMPAIVPSDGIVSPTYIPDLVNASLDMVMDGEHGVWHLANEGEISWHEFARALARRAGLGEDFLSVAAAATPEDEANYPAYSALASERGAVMPTFENALDRYFNDVSNRISTTIPT